jgi:mannose-6-phosphate isomerase-like protein (cupin superfamily)
MESVRLGGFTVTRMVFQPGWRWTDDLPSIMGTDTCEIPHPAWIVLSGRFAIQMNNGTEKEFGPGDLGMIPPGHDAWVVGNEPVMGIDIQVNGT